MAAPTREGNLEAPTRHPLDWKNPDFYDEASLFKEMERVFDICHGCRRCVSLCQSFPTLFDLVDESPTMEVDGVAKADYVEGRGPLLPVRPVLHDQVSLCAAARMERGFPASDAQSQGGEVQEWRREVARPDTDQHRHRRQPGRHPGGGPGRECGQQDRRCAQGTGSRRGYPCRCMAAGIPQQPVAHAALSGHRSSTQAEPAGTTTGKDRAVRHLLHEPQRAGAGRGLRRGVRAQRHSRHAGGTGTLLRHAQAGTGQSGRGGRRPRSSTSRCSPNSSTRAGT